MSQFVSLACSPDTDDAFMVYALQHRHVIDPAYSFEFFFEDIQKLNEKARECRFDITAISIAVFPDIQDNYILMPIGASVGRRFGPAVIVNRSSDIRSVKNLQAKRIAIPGFQTSAFFAALDVLPPFQAIPVPFIDIEKRIADHSVDAGIVIHELQLNCEERGFRKVCDLGVMWADKYSMPLPLGGIAIRRTLGQQTIKELTSLYKKSVEWAIKNRSFALNEASKKAIAGLNESLASRYIDMYVNNDSLEYQSDVRQAIMALFEGGAKRGLCRWVEPKDVFALNVRGHLQ